MAMLAIAPNMIHDGRVMAIASNTRCHSTRRAQIANSPVATTHVPTQASRRFTR
jgi:hypothetical protein